MCATHRSPPPPATAPLGRAAPGPVSALTPAPPPELPALPVLPAEHPVPIDRLRGWLGDLDAGLDAITLVAVAGAPLCGDEGGSPVRRLPAACWRRSAAIDRLLAALWTRAIQRSGAAAKETSTELALFALGSFGRQELCPASDIDLLILQAPEIAPARLRGLSNDFITPLWDLGLKTSHIVYTAGDLDALAARVAALDEEAPGAAAAQQQLTSLFDARPIAASAAGANAALPDLVAFRTNFLARHGYRFALHKAREIADRWSTLHVRPWELPLPGWLEPHLKDGLGGLRDAAAADWIFRALGERAASVAVAPSALRDAALAPGSTGVDSSLTENPVSLLLRFRVLLHRLAGRAQDRLLQSLQGELIDRLLRQTRPALLAEEPDERLQRAMAPLYQAMERIHARAEAACAAVARGPRRGRSAPARRRLERTALDGHWTRVGRELHPSAAGLRALARPDGLTVALRGALLAQEQALELGRPWLELADAGHAVFADPPPAEAAALFRRLLAHPEPIYPVLVALHRARLITAAIPEFAAITGRAQRAPLHEVTVDIHTLRVVGALEHWRDGDRPEDRERAALVRGLKRLDLLRLAALLHDIGKAHGDAGHPERGSLMAHDILSRLNYPLDDIHLVRILIEEHLTLFDLTTLDEADRGPFERLSGRLENRTALDLLYLLSVADAQGVAVGALPLWREDRLRALWQGLRGARSLRPAAAAPRTAAAPPAASPELRDDLQAALLHADRRLRRQLAGHFKTMPARYLTRIGAETAVAHVRLIERLGRQDGAVQIHLPTPPAVPGRRRARPSPRTAVRPPAGRAGAGAATATAPVGELTVVTRDRPGRFSQICAGISGAGLTVISAEVYERADGLILDLFRVMPAPQLAGGLTPRDPRAHLKELLEQADTLILRILHDPPRAAAVMEHLRAHPLLRLRSGSEVNPPATAGSTASAGAPGGAHEAAVQLRDASHEPLTIVDIRCDDRPGLLYALTRAIADLGLNIHFATIDTVRGTATDVFYLSEPDGRNLKDETRRANLRLLLKAVAEQNAAGKFEF
ncbi:MAG: ACT domain-containing protein [Planctomycetota bacterium]